MAEGDELRINASLDGDLAAALQRIEQRLDAVADSLGGAGKAGKTAGDAIESGAEGAAEALKDTERAAENAAKSVEQVGTAGRSAAAGMAAAREASKKAAKAFEETQAAARGAAGAVDEAGDEAAESGVKAAVASTGWGRLDRMIARSERTTRMWVRAQAMLKWSTYADGVDKVTAAWNRLGSFNWGGLGKKLQETGKKHGKLGDYMRFLMKPMTLIILNLPVLLGLLGALGSGAVVAASGLMGLVRAGGAFLPILVAVKVGMLAWKQAAESVAPEMDALKKRFEGLGAAVAKGGLSKGLTTLNRDIGGFAKETEKGFGRIGAAFGRGATGLGDLLKNAETLDKVAYIFAGMEHILDYLIGTVLNLGRALLSLTAAGTPVAKQMAEQFRAISGGLADWMEQAERSGKLTKWIQAGYDQLRRTIGVLVDFVIGLYNVFKIAAGYSSDLGTSVEGAARKFRAWTTSISGQNSIKQYFADAMPVFKEAVLLVAEIFKTIMSFASSDGLAPLLKQLREEFLPAVTLLLTHLTGEGGLLPSLVDIGTEGANFMSNIDTTPLASMQQSIADCIAGATELINQSPLLSGLASTFVLLYVVGGAALTVIGTGAAAFAWMQAAILMTGELTIAQTIFGAVVGNVRLALALLRLQFLAATGATTLWGAALYLATLPITWIIIAVIALVAAFIWAYNNVDWFRDAVDTTLRALGDFFSWLWNDVVIPGIKAVGDFFVWLGGVFVDVWTVIANATSWAWDNVMFPIISTIWTVLRILGTIIFTILVAPFLIAWNIICAVFTWAWNAFIKPILILIGKQIEWLNNTVVQPVLGWIADKWNWLMMVLTVAKLVFLLIMSAIGAKISELWATYVQPILDWIAEKWNWLMWVLNIAKLAFLLMMDMIGGKISELWNKYVQPILNWIADKWNWLMTMLDAVKRAVIDPMFSGIGRGLDGLGAWFDRTVQGISDTWNTLRSALAKPINFVIDNVWNGGIIKAWNMAAGMLGLSPAPELARIPENAKGGVIPGWSPGKDDQLSWVSGGEAIMRPEWTRAMGRSYIDRMNKLARTGGTKAVQRAANRGGMLSPAEKLYGGDRANPGLAFAGGGVVPGQQWANSQAGKPYVWGGTGPGGYDCSGFMSAITNFLTGDSLYSRRFSTGSFSSSRGAGGFAPGKGAFTIGVSPNTGDGIGHMAGSLGNMNVESRGSDGVVTGPNARGAINSLFPWQFFLPQIDGVFQGSAGSGGGGGGWFDFGAAVREAFTAITDPILDAIPFKPPPDFMAIPKALGTKARDSLLDLLVGKADASGGGGGGTGGTEQWRGVVMNALGMLGLPGILADTTLRRMNQESGGNPRAINNWDSNAAKGTPSKGLMQVIDPTFRSNWDPRTPNDIWNPISNIVASMRYALGRYGSLPAAYDRSGGYDSGGWLMPGATMAINETGQPEAVLTAGQWDMLDPSHLVTAMRSTPPTVEARAASVREDALADAVHSLSAALAERPPALSVSGEETKRQVRAALSERDREQRLRGRYGYGDN